MSKPSVIALCGKAGSGKDTFADVFVQNGYTKIALADPIKRIAHVALDIPSTFLWGDSSLRGVVLSGCNRKDRLALLDRAVQAADGLPDLSLVWDTRKPYDLREELEYLVDRISDGGVSVREVIQALGDWGREKHQSLWVELFKVLCTKVLAGSHTYSYETGLTAVEPSDVIKPRGVVVPDVRYYNEASMCSVYGFPLVKIYRDVSKISHHSSEEGLSMVDFFAAQIQNDSTREAFIQQATELMLKLEETHFGGTQCL
jgi:hypothetical protein